MDFLNQGFTSFRGVNTRGSIAFRFVADVYGNESTLAVKPSEDTAYAWKLPSKSGTFPISGTFSVDLPAVTANSIASTAVTVSGIRIEDALTVVPQGTYTSTGTRGVLLLVSSVPGNGSVTLQFAEVVGTASVPISGWVMGYTAQR